VSSTLANRVEPRTWNELVVARWAGSSAPAVVDDDATWSGEELLARAGGASSWLDGLGFAPGAPVPALVDESAAAIALTVGAALSGRPLAPLGTRLTATELAAALRGLGADAVIAEGPTAALAGDAAASVGIDVHVLAGVPPRGPLPSHAAAPDDLVAIVHTSGTTGAPKSVPIRHQTLLPRIPIHSQLLGFGPGARYSSASPLHHTGGITMVLSALGAGTALIPQAWFSIDGWRRVGELGVTCALLVPTMIDLLLAEGALGDARPVTLQYGAAPIHVDTLRAALAALPDTKFIQIFGQTEVSPITALTHADHLRALAGRPELLATVGRPVLGLELAVEHPDLDGVGEIAIRAPHAFVADADGWRRTGDLGTVDGEGYVRLRGRTGDRIVRGGENIYPAEIEAVLVTHPQVREVAVVGIADQRWGEVVRAVVVPIDPSAPPTLGGLRELARDRLAHFKAPVELVVVDALPRNANGKVVRRFLSTPT
jgi:acyl-CoA synthetase (AMP-forming)/AMP-acid ligase II